MKKLLLLATAAFLSLGSMAQKANITSAINYLKDKDVANAKKMVDEALKNESTMNNAKAWFLKGLIYQAIGTPKSEQMPFITFMLSSTSGEQAYPINLDDANQFAAQHPNALDESLEAYKKSMELNPKYEKNEYLMLLPYMIYAYFNQGITQMNDSKFNDAYASLGKLSVIKGLDNGKWYGDNKQLDTLFATGRMYQGNCAYQTGKDDEALAILEECVKSPVTQNPDLFIMLTDIYDRKKNDAKWTETMKMAKSKYPNDKRIINNEINYYRSNGKSDVLINSLKEGIAAEPGKADLYLILGETYYNMANPTEKGKSLPKPANAKELEQNALTNYTKAAELDPKSAYAQFYLGLFNYNHAKELTDEMNKADDKKYAAMKPERDATIDKAIPFLDKAKSLMEAEGVNDSNRDMYRQTLSGMMQAYQITQKAEKSAEIQKILEGVK